MFKILLATDGSDSALKAVDHTSKLAERMNDAEITVLNVVDVSALPIHWIPHGAAEYSIEPVNVDARIAQLLKQLDEESNNIVKDAQDRLMGCRRPTYSLSVRGRPWEVICETAKREKFDLVVMGSVGRGLVAEILLGSVSNKVLHCSKVPVLIVPGKRGE